MWPYKSGIMELCRHPWLFLLFLGIILVNVLQISAYENSCNETQYLSEGLNKCCTRCPPGHYKKNECTHSTDTLCMPCENGKYAAKWNYSPNCRTCYPCSKILVEREPCSTTQNTVCGCPDGQYCTQLDALNVCQICEPLPTSLPTVSETNESPPEMKTIWIIVGVVGFILTAIVAIICLKTPLLKNFGRIIKNKTCSESVPQAETTVDLDIVVVGSVHGDPASPLLKDGQIKTPLQEEGKALNYPIQETDATQTGEFALLSKRVE